MTFWLGVFIFALGIFISVCLHEAGHLLTAKRFGMKATQYFAGFGPTLWSFRRGETEYGVKAIPAGGFVKIVGMTPLEEVPAEDTSRAFWRFPLWQRTVVLVAGSLTHFMLAIVIFYLAALTTGLPNPAALDYDVTKQPAVVGKATPCVVNSWDRQVAGDKCRASDPLGPARAAGLRAGDRVVAVGDRSVRTFGDLVTAVRANPVGDVRVTYIRDGVRHVATVDLVTTQRPVREGSTKVHEVSAIGISADTSNAPPVLLHHGLVGGAGAAVWFTGQTVGQTFHAIKAFPSKIPKLVDALNGQQRDENTPISVVGASRIGGEAVANDAFVIFLVLLGGLNVFIGIFNLLPLLPLDGGHVAVIWYERVRSWLAARRGQPDPGRVDYNKLLPLTYVVILAFGGLTLLTLAADIVNPITLSP